MKTDFLKEEKKKKKRMAVTTSKGLTFAKKQLKKHGWKKGKGLGKQENGIAEALKVKMKCNTAGVGHDSAKEFTFHWWDHLFNSSVANITVDAGQDGVQVRKTSEREGPVTSTKPWRAKEGNMLYSRFVKAATLISGTEEPMNPMSSVEQEEEKLDLATASRLTDQELFQACGGRTVHKGARHGITMRAKLARLEEQEKAFLASSVQWKDGLGMAPSGCPDPQAKKRKRRKTGAATEKSQVGEDCLKAKPKKKKMKTNGKELNGP
ncbi:G patch domain-containing protein 4 isoform X1 [Crotalus tigris]|uniref:G patch domain-containing protein 4 isoform X1 n=1 Tax=Crotalus tigris TaxID=88082 RepID=UPI00192F1B17|nr:G patch domain-containing protein 4 isoform X1 [Crotalus tigris]XP_039209556.1 G patch domain-containing protein 4 isoform X1 [Crotalus tigris]XP_039209559.1 G patch domain-containing protein 4 isoform X1 [Crotalus tigris]